MGAIRTDVVVEAGVFLDANILFGDRRHFGSAFGRTVGGVAIHSPRSLAEAALAAGR